MREIAICRPGRCLSPGASFFGLNTGFRSAGYDIIVCAGKGIALNGKTNRTAGLILFAFAIAGLLCSARILWKRAEFERAGRTVQIAVDMPSLYAIAPPGTDMKKVFDRLEDAGVTAFGVFEYKSKRLVESKLMRYEYPASAGEAGAREEGIRLGLDAARAPAELRGNWKPYLESYFGPGTCGGDTFECSIPAIDKNQFEEISFGLAGAPGGLRITPRLFNTPFENRATIKEKVESIPGSQGRTVIIFDGDSVLGHPGLIDVAASAINSRDDLVFGMVEITKQDGARRLAQKLRGRVVPVHSIPADELAKTPRPEAVDRFRRAVRERGIRYVYVRPYTTLYGLSPGEALERNIEYVEEIAGGIKADGFETGVIEPMKPFIVSRLLRTVCIAGAAAFVWLLGCAALGLPAAPGIALSVGALAAGMLLPGPGGAGVDIDLLAKLAALGVACAAPALAVSVFFLDGRGRDRAMPFGENAIKWAGSCAVTVAGAVFIAAMLSQRSFFLRLDHFTGVKLSFLAPLLIFFFIYLRKTKLGMREFLATPLKYSEVLAGLALLAAMAIYIMRSGNEAPAAVSGIEVNLRMALESLLEVRPRTKEFLIGHPALLLAGLFPASRKSFFPLLVLFAGLVGQISITNTFCHLHSPIMLTWTRTALGMLLGFGLGIVLRALAPPLIRLFYNGSRD